MFIEESSLNVPILFIVYILQNFFFGIGLSTQKNEYGSFAAVLNFSLLTPSSAGILLDSLEDANS